MTRPSAGADSFPRGQALTRRFTLGEPRDVRVSGDGTRVVFLRSTGPVDPVNSLWMLDVAAGIERLVADPRRLVDPGGDGRDCDGERIGRNRGAGDGGEGVGGHRGAGDGGEGVGGHSGVGDGGGRVRESVGESESGDGAPAAERARRERVRETAEGIVSYDADEALACAVFALGGRLWRVTLDGADPPEPLDALPGAFDPRLSPDSARVAYAAGSALRVTGDAVGDRAVIDEPGETVSWGAAEFVAAEEMGRTRGHWWSPDGERLLVARVDTAAVPRWWIADPASPGREPAEIRYPAAGAANAAVSLAIFDVGAVVGTGHGGGAPRSCRTAPTRPAGAVAGTGHGCGAAAGAGVGCGAGVGGSGGEAGLSGAGRVDVAWDEGGWEYLAGVRWSTDGLLLTVQTRDQRTLGVLQADPATGACRLLHSVTDADWVDLVPGVPRLAGTRLVTVEDRGSGALSVDPPLQTSVSDRGSTRSEERGTARRLCVDGEALTPGSVEVRAVHHADDEGVIITASVDPAEVHAARVGWDGRLEWLTSAPGVHGVAAGGDTVVTVSRSLEHPGRRCTVRSPHRAAQDLLIASHAAEPGLELNVEIVELGPRRLVSALVLPAGSAGPGDGPLPVLLDPYGGPHAQRVQRAEALFHTSQWFADQGFAVLVVDGRGTPGRGPDFERAVRGDLAGPVLDDQIEALGAAAGLCPRLDLARVAVRGWSFGGYLAALAVLRRPDVFAAAIAGAPVTDWRLYDTHYAERYLGHPAAEPGNYARTDLVSLASGLRRPLMLIHGLVDDNVVAAHTLRLSQALTEAGRPHTVLPLSGVTHMTSQEEVAENLLLLQLRFLRIALGLQSSTTAVPHDHRS